MQTTVFSPSAAPARCCSPDLIELVTLDERGENDGFVLYGSPRPLSLTLMYAAGRRSRDLSQISAALRGEFDRIGAQVETDLAGQARSFAHLAARQLRSGTCRMLSLRFARAQVPQTMAVGPPTRCEANRFIVRS